MEELLRFTLQHTEQMVGEAGNLSEYFDRVEQFAVSLYRLDGWLNRWALCSYHTHLSSWDWRPR